ncbi:mitochondrial ATP synthase g subunit-domain-containing protein [Biscogniauxia mediterranea]|nr:mitochondrial ATP synthase g subunit-domain-containing protein [Biscogniauxia mediterranea]
MSSTLARPMLRQSGRFAARRFESTNATKAAETTKQAAETAKQAAAKASATASKFASQAQEGLSKVTATAGPAIANAAKGLANSLGQVGGRTSKVVGVVEKYTPTVIFYSKVAAELAKIVFRGRQMSPPSLQTFQTYFQNAWKSLQNPSALTQYASELTSKVSQQPIMQQVQNINRAQLANAGVVAIECLGFFTVGEMIGRGKIVGYRGDAGAAHH